MQQRQYRSIWPFAIVLFLLLMVSLALVTQDYTRRASIAEAVRIEAEMGQSTLQKVNALADTWYLGIRRVLKSNVVLSAEDFYSDDTLQRRREEQFLDTLLESTHEGKFANWLIEREQAMLDLLYWILRRMALFVVLLPLWIPMAVLALFHGLQDRAIKKTDFGYTSPVLNHWARQVISFGIATTLLIFFAPIAVNPIVFPVIMAAVTVAMGVAVGNIQKRI